MDLKRLNETMSALEGALDEKTKGKDSIERSLRGLLGDAERSGSSGGVLIADHVNGILGDETPDYDLIASEMDEVIGWAVAVKNMAKGQKRR